MILFTNGCSWTWGGALESYFSNNTERLQLLWPHHLGKMLNASKVINLAEGCGSNQRIIRTTFDWFLKEYKNDEPVLAILQITNPARYEYYVTDDLDDFTNDSGYWTLNTPSSVIAPKIVSYEEAVRYNEVRNSKYTYIEGMYRLVSDCSSLAKLFDMYNVKYHIWPGAFRFPSQYPLVYTNYLEKTCNMWNIDNSWEYDRVSVEDEHPSLSGHKQIAERIYNQLKL